MKAYKNMHGNLTCNSEFDLGGNKIVKLSTYKNSAKKMITYATAYTVDDRGIMSTMLFSDYSKPVITAPCARATAKALEEQHKRAVDMLDTIKAGIAAHYAKKAGA